MDIYQGDADVTHAVAAIRRRSAGRTSVSAINNGAAPIGLTITIGAVAKLNNPNNGIFRR
jgi:hypothetical protein